MTKGTASMGEKSGKSHLVIRCRRCGRRSYHVRHKKCAHCGFGVSSRLKRYNWQTKRHGKTRRVYRQ